MPRNLSSVFSSFFSGAEVSAGLGWMDDCGFGLPSLPGVFCWAGSAVLRIANVKHTNTSRDVGKSFFMGWAISKDRVGVILMNSAGNEKTGRGGGAQAL